MNTLKKPISEARLRANRANALKSTGPRTAEGKQRSSQNAVTHGLTAKDITALGEDYLSLPELLQSLTDSWNPRNAFEHTLVHNLATLQIRLNRCVRMETGLLDMDIPQVTSADSRETANSALALAFVSREASFMHFSRYEANLSRAYDRTVKQLLAVRKENLDPTPLRDLSRLGRVKSGGAGDETKPIPIENIDPPSATEPDPPAIRFDPDPPADPKDAVNRRHGSFTRLPEKTRHTAELIWISEPRKEDTDPDAPGPRVPRG